MVKMIINKEPSLDFDDVLIKPNRSTLSSRANVNLERTFKFYHSQKELICLPIICSNLASVAGIDIAKALQKHKIITCLHKYIDLIEVNDLFCNKILDKDYCWLTIGQSEDELQSVLKKVNTQNINICVDVANGHMDSFVNFCSRVRFLLPNAIIMAGNVSVSESVQELIIHGGVDIVKVGTGPGRFCKTRLVTGVGVPQLSAIISCSSVAHGLKSKAKRLGLICGDGGCKTSGDICKGFSGGADFIMLGDMFSGVEESCGDWYRKDSTCLGQKYKKVDNPQMYNMEELYLLCYGMSSKTAQLKFGAEKKYRTSEGEEEQYIKYKGPVDNIVQEICGGLRSCGSYIGAESIKDFNKCATFLLCNKQK